MTAPDNRNSHAGAAMVARVGMHARPIHAVAPHSSHAAQPIQLNCP